MVVCTLEMSSENVKKGRIERGTVVHLGSPKKPDSDFALFLATTLAHFPEVKEAHLPQCFAPKTMARPAPVLVVIMDKPPEPLDGFSHRISTELAPRLAASEHLDIWYLSPHDSFLESVRKADCKILYREESGEPIVLRPWSTWNKLRRRLRKGADMRRMGGRIPFL
jgi:hypothetical protein